MPLAKVEEAVVPEARIRSTLTVDEAWTAPETWKVPATLEEAEEINPEREASPLTLKVEEADNGPLIFKELEIVEEPRTSRPPRLVNWPASVSTPASKVEKIKLPWAGS